MAFACFRANVPIVTVYATLGEEAIAEAIVQTEATILITSAELLPKITKLQEKCPMLHTLVYFPLVDPKAKLADLEPFRFVFDEVGGSQRTISLSWVIFFFRISGIF